MLEKCENLIQILLADDHSLIRHGLRNLIQHDADLLVVGEAGHGEEVLQLLACNTVDLVILDISMPNGGGLNALREIKAQYPHIKILMLTMHDNVQFFYGAMDQGADGYLLKDDSDEELLSAIHKLMAGRTYVSPHFMEDFTEGAVRIFRKRGKTSFQGITAREKEVLKLVVDGFTSKQIAVDLGVSRRTIDNHRANLLRKFSKKNSVDLVNHVITSGFLGSE